MGTVKKQVNKAGQQGFSYIEVMCAMVVLMIGILGQLSALSWSVLRQRESEQQNMARQVASSTFESIFAARDLSKDNGLDSWDKINTQDVNTNGLFVAGWTPVRQDSGKDGIQGTNDDACAETAPCQVNGYVNKSPVMSGVQRKVIITDIASTDGKTVRKRRIEVKIRYIVGQAVREQSVATVIADLPFYK